MNDIARAAGVSQAAVSYAYNQPHKLSAARREHILTVAAELGYAGPNPAGRTLRTGRVGAIGLLITDTLGYAFDDPAAVQLLKGISEVGEFAEVALTLLPCPLESPRLTEGGGVLVRGAVDGFLAYAMPDGHPGMATVVARGLPIVVIDGSDLGHLPRVGIPDRKAAREIAAHVLGLGHRRVGVLVDRLVPDGAAGPVTPARERAARDLVNKERLAGYRSAFRSAGVSRRETTVIEAGGFDYAASRAAAAALLRDRSLTAVLAATDVLALATIDAATELGLRVPRDLSVTGFDDIAEAAKADLTTVRQPLVEKGRQAARLLLDVIAGEQATAVTLPTELVVRGSTAPPRRR
ncbi:LacI family DNA-binding transcriptional regulator [Amycolatopsis dongchuanensis]|uniref:DNA-binding transcriptional regulator, LacI/PurR family n=3 Tax=Pseudonocardiaceae TaxID=2070 RepID=A0A1I3WNA9_9PSEU|nr:DNA-binding transcriptional regulator, LacI/PurR family [Amycolatopsis sacchari]